MELFICCFELWLILFVLVNPFIIIDFKPDKVNISLSCRV